MPRAPETLLFLPGASGNTRIWQPVSDRLAHPAKRHFMGWPGFGDTPTDPSVDGFDALVDQVTSRLTKPVAIFAQSMGGTIALCATLAKPEFVTHMVLSVTSCGIDVTSLGAHDWRPEFRRENPNLPHWFEDARLDLTDRLSALEIPVLLLWGNADPISPVAVGQRLQLLLPGAELVVIHGGRHDLVSEHADEIIDPIRRHLKK